MALIHFEKFSKYVNSATGWTDLVSDNLNYYTSGAGPDILAGAGRFGDAALSIDTARFFSLPWNTETADTTIVAGMSFMLPNFVDGADYRLIAVGTTSSTATQHHFRVFWSNSFLLVLDGLGTTIARAPCPLNTYHTLEVKCTMTNTGSITVRLNGVDICTAVAGDYLFTTTTLAFVQFARDSAPAYIDWLYLLDSTGSNLNDFLGDFKVETVIPDANGGTAAWTASAGSNFQCIDDALAGYDDDTTYISSSTVNQDNLASHAAVSLTGLNAIKFVNLTALTRDDGTNDVALLMVNGVDTIVSATFTTGTAYQWQHLARALAPDGSAWSVANINATEFGVRTK